MTQIGFQCQNKTTTSKMNIKYAKKNIPFINLILNFINFNSHKIDLRFQMIIVFPPDKRKIYKQ